MIKNYIDKTIEEVSIQENGYDKHQGFCIAKQEDDFLLNYYELDEDNYSTYSTGIKVSKEELKEFVSNINSLLLTDELVLVD